MSWRKSHTRRKHLRRDGINIKCGHRVFNVRLAQKWTLTPEQAKRLDAAAYQHIEDYILR